MKNVSLIALILALGSGVAFAQECSEGSCEVAPTKDAPKATVSVAAKLEKMQASADKGCTTSKDMLAKLQKEFNADSTATLIKMAAACEKNAGNGCEVSKKIMAKVNASMAAKKPVTLSMRLMKLSKGCEKGCDKSKTLMASLVKAYEVKDAKALIAQVQAWETKASNGCKKCVAKLSTLSAKLPSKKPALSMRLMKLNKGCEKGCETSKAKMATLVTEYKAENADALIATVQSWEKKASNGCKKCVGKLSTLSAKLAPAKAAAETKAEDAQCTGCKDCDGACTGCDKGKAKAKSPGQ